MGVQPFLERLGDRLTSCLANAVPVLGRLAADVCLDHIERGSTSQHLSRKRGRRRRMQPEELAPLCTQQNARRID
jgi:hypothetical protein